MNVPTVFLSAASDDLREWRNVLHKALERAGCKVFTQDASLGASSGTVLDLLRRHLDQSDFVIHLAGLAYGAEPERPPFETDPTFKCSYTQFEYYYAHQKGKPVIAFVCAEGFPYLTFSEKGQDAADRARRRQLQEAHRERVAKGHFTGTPVAGHPDRPLSEPVTDVKVLLEAVTAAVGTILQSSQRTTNVADELGHALGFKCDIARFDVVNCAPTELVDRDGELKALNDAWTSVCVGAPMRPHILAFVALGGEGKTGLVAKWAADLAHRDWPGCHAVFAWSFNGQGASDDSAASSEPFLVAALAFFGDSEMAGSAADAREKGRRLAQLISRIRALVILDGVEPLQYPPTSPTPGELKDPGLASLLKGLAAVNHGLCVVSTRYALADVRAWWQTTAPMHPLLRLPNAAGVKLLRALGVTTGSQTEFERLVEDVDGHALTLSVVGQFLARAFHGDIRARDRVDLWKADLKVHGGKAFNAIDAYVQWLENGSAEATRELTLLNLLGLFDRAAAADCIAVLRRAPAIPGFTEPLVDLAEDDWEFSLSALRDTQLLRVNRAEGSGELRSLDGHPLLREYFARRLREQRPEAWRAAHRRIYEHLCASTQEGMAPSLEALQPLYQAVFHGCQAGCQQEACDAVYRDRIQRGNAHYTWIRLGAYGSALNALACFFETPWSRVSQTLTQPAQSWLLNEAAFCLRAQGRLTEAISPFHASLDLSVSLSDWESAAVDAVNLSELNLALGDLAGAGRVAGQAVGFADRGRDQFRRSEARATQADALHQAGRRVEADSLFRLAEEIQKNDQPEYPQLYSWMGFRYCDLLLAPAERAAWQTVLWTGLPKTVSGSDLPARIELEKAPLSERCRVVSDRTERIFAWRRSAQWDSGGDGLLDIALDHLSLSRALLYAAIVEGSPLAASTRSLESAVAALRRGNDTQRVPLGLLTRAWSRAMAGSRTGTESSQSDLDEAFEIAGRGPMPLFLADVHLHRIRLFFREPDYPWDSPAADLAIARSLIAKHGYFRRREELEDASAAVSLWSMNPPA